MNAGMRGEIVLHEGRIARVTCDERAPYLGAILYEQGAIAGEVLDRSLAEIARTKKLHGQVLLEAGVITQSQLDAALAEQSYRRVHLMFAWPGSTTFALRDGIDDVVMGRDASRPAIDAWRAVWRGTRAYPPLEHVSRSLDRIAGDVQITDLASAARLGLDDDEHELAERLAHVPIPVDALMAASPLGAVRTRALLWCLALARALSATATRPLSPLELGPAGIRARARDIEHEDPWRVLGLPRGAPLEAARAAYFRLARQWHPNRLPRELLEVREDCRAVFAAIADAHRTIRDLYVDREAGHAHAPAPAPTLRDADEALAVGDRARAIEIASAVARGGVHGPDARALVAWCQAQEGGDADRAIAELDRILGGDPDCVRALLYRARLHERSGRDELALKDLRRVLRIDPRHADAGRDLRLLSLRTARAAASTRDDGEEGAHREGSGLFKMLARVASRT